MKTKYTFLNESFKDSANIVGFGTLIGAITGAVKSIIIRCKGDERIRDKELRRLSYMINVYKHEIKNITDEMNKAKDYYLDRSEYRKQMDRYNVRLMKVKSLLLEEEAKYKIIKSMPLSELKRKAANKQWLQSIARWTIGSIAGVSLHALLTQKD